MSSSDSLELIDEGTIQINTTFLLSLSSLPDGIVFKTINRDANEAITTANVVWPDGVEGTFTTLVASTAFPGAIDSYSVTHRSTTYTQPTMTRNASGSVIYRPELVVS